MNIIKLCLIIPIIIINITISYAHPWRTASDWCHYCRTNCDSRWVGRNVRHCHGWSSNSSNSYSSYTNNCPTNSQYSILEKWCICNIWYAPSLNYNHCIKIPENAHIATNSNTDVWLCNQWYEEIWNSCHKIINNEEEQQLPVFEVQELDFNNNTQTPKNESITNNNFQNTNSNNNWDNDDWLLYILIAWGWYYFYKKRKKEG